MGRGIVVAFGVVVAFAAGIGVGLVLGGATAPEVVVARESPTAIEPAPGDAAPGHAPASAPPPAAHRARPDAPLADERPPVGTGVISGTVRSSQGEPVEGVDIIAQAPPPEAWSKELEGRPWEDRPLEERVERLARAERWRDATSRRVKSAADGTYTLTGVPDLPHRVDARSELHRVRPAQGSSARDVRPGGTVHFTADPRTGVVLDVRLPDGTQPESAQVKFQRGKATSMLGWTPSSGRVDTDVGPASMTVEAGKWSEFQSETIDVNVPARPSAEAQVVRLRSRPGILLVAKAAPGFEGLRTTPAITGVSGEDVIGDERGRPRRADAAAEQVFLDLSPGVHTVTLTHDGASFAKAQVTVGEGLARVELTAPPPAAARVVEVTVTPAATTTGRVEFRWVKEDSESRWEYRTPYAERRPGDWIVLVPGANDPPAGGGGSGTGDPGQVQWTLAVVVDNVPRGQSVWTPGTASLTIVATEPMSIDVVVDGIAGTGLERKLQATALVVKRSAKGGYSAMGAGNATVDEKGRCRIGPIAPQTIELSIAAGTRGRPGVLLGHTVVEGAPGVREVRFQLPPLETVTFDAGAPGAGQDIRVTVADDALRTRDPMNSGFQVTADAQGRAVARWVPPGTYTARCGTRTVEFTVPGQTLVSWPTDK